MNGFDKAFQKSVLFPYKNEKEVRKFYFLLASCPFCLVTGIPSLNCHNQIEVKMKDIVTESYMSMIKRKGVSKSRKFSPAFPVFILIIRTIIVSR